jgi:hypothetical protein
MQQKEKAFVPNSGGSILIHDIFIKQSPLRAFLPLHGAVWRG